MADLARELRELRVGTARGPWNFFPQADGDLVVAGPDGPVAHVSGVLNARLVARTPELLDRAAARIQELERRVRQLEQFMARRLA